MRFDTQIIAPLFSRIPIAPDLMKALKEI